MQVSIFLKIVLNHGSSTSLEPHKMALFPFPPFFSTISLDLVWSNDSTILKIFSSQKIKDFKRCKEMCSVSKSSKSHFPLGIVSWVIKW